MDGKTFPDFGNLAALPVDESDAINRFASDLHTQMNDVMEQNVKSALINWAYAVLWKINTMESLYPSRKSSPQQILKDVKQFLLMVTQIRDTKDFNQEILKFLGDMHNDTGERDPIGCTKEN